MSRQHHHAERDSYWARRYEAPDWDSGIHIGAFPPGRKVTLAQASAAADAATSRTILEGVSLYRMTAGLRVLEIGCGSGGLAAELFAKMPGLTYVGYEVGEAAIEAARKRIAALLARGIEPAGSLPDFRLGGVAAAVEEQGRRTGEQGFDLIIIREVYYLLSNEERRGVQALVQSCLRTGGVLLFADLFSVGDAPGEVVKADLYGRHQSQGDYLLLPRADKEAVAGWFTEQFGSGLRAVEVNIDTTSIAATYQAALDAVEPGAADPANLAAYTALRDLARGGIGRAASLIYVEAVIFNDRSGMETVLDDEDFCFVPKRAFQKALRKGEVYGVKAGAWNLIVGRSGGGKTTILRALQGDLRRHLEGNAHPLRGRRYFILAQDMDLFDSFSPSDNVLAFGGERVAVDGLLKKLGLSDDFRKRRDSHGASGGERQRVAIAQSLVAQPEVLLLDEPLKGLDRARRVVLFDLLKEELSRFAKSEFTVVCTDHAFEAIEREFDYVFEVMYGRQVLIAQRQHTGG